MYEITTKDLLKELGEDFKKTLSELSFEKAAKIEMIINKPV